MGLIDLKTDFTSLRYGKDTIGGGYSGQPYIQEKIPNSFNNLGANEDFILRGGANAIGDSITDIRRLTKMFFDLKSPNGLIFIAKQNLLSRTAVRTQTSGIVNEGIYTPLNTLAQAGVAAIGGHLNKQGLNPLEQTGAYANDDNLYSVRVKPTQDINLNRLVTIYNDINQGTATSNFGFVKGVTINPDARIGGKAVPVLMSYIGGPGSKIGIGNTNIRYSTFRTGDQNPLFVTNPNFFTGKNNQKSVDADNKQIGGLKIDFEKPWTKSPLYGLPTFNINSPQSSSLTNIPYGPLTWTAKSNISSSFVVNGQFSRYNPLLNGISGVNNIYDLIFGVNTIENRKRSFDGNPLWYNNVYISGSLEINSEVIGSNTWTPPQVDRVNPYGGNYKIGTDKSIEYDINNSKGVTNTSLIFTNITLGADQFIFQNPSVYKPVVKGEPLLEPNTEKLTQNGTITYDQQLLIKAEPSRYSPSIKEDFRKVLRKSITNNSEAEKYLKSGNIVPNSYISYAADNIGVKNLLGNPGIKDKNLSNFSEGTRNKDTIDKINASEPGTDLSSSDLIPFKITNLQSGQVLTFRAFLGGITDSYTAEINTQKYVGRGENFYTYNGQTRKISLSWTVASLSKEELLPMYRRLNALAGNTAPKYVDGFMQGPLVKITIGGYINELPGYIEGFSLEMAEDSTWEIGINPDGSKNTTTSQLTHVIKVNGFNFTPIPTYLPQVGAPFISISQPS